MIRLITLVHLRPGCSAEGVVELEALVGGLSDEVACVHRTHLGKNIPGQVGAGDYTWDSLILDGDAGDILRAPKLLALLEGNDVIERLDSVAFEPADSRIAEPGISDCLKRTLLVRVPEETPPEIVARFERDILGMPDHIRGIRNWAFSRADPSLCPTGWTHVWEQEYLDQSGFDEDYMMHPYHWGLVDGWFDPECPQQIVDPNFAHALCPAETTILGWR